MSTTNCMHEEEIMEKTGIELIAEERKAHLEKHGYALRHDINNNAEGQLAFAAACYALPDVSREYCPWRGGLPLHWPWSARAWNPKPDDRVAELIKAGALIAAEIDRLLATEKE